jgi:large subunit ribosomal protein L6e
MPRKLITRNKLLIRGIPLYGRSASYHRSGKWAKKNKKPIEKKKEEKKMIIKEFGKKKEKREIKRPRETRFYPTEDIPKPIPSRKNHHHPTKLRSSITPGTILIILSLFSLFTRDRILSHESGSNLSVFRFEIFYCL